jgi:hypothetical protein
VSRCKQLVVGAGEAGVTVHHAALIYDKKVPPMGLRGLRVPGRMPRSGGDVS